MRETEKDIYIGEDGLAYCSHCKTPRERLFPESIMGKDYKVHVMCTCQREAFEKEQKIRKQQEFDAMVARNRSACFKERRMQEWTFAADDGTIPAMDKAKAFVRDWETVRSENAGLLFWGGVGSGKTFMAAAIANALLDRGLRVLMCDFAQISNLSVFDSEEYVRSLADYDLLILDDLGAERKSEFALQNVFHVINRRWECGKPLVITTNLSIAEMKARNEMQELRIYDRIFDLCIPVCVNGKSKRRESGEHKKTVLCGIFEKEQEETL